MLKQKLTSRKLWLTILGGIATAVYAPAYLPVYLKWAVPTYVVSEGTKDALTALGAARAAKKK